jgi:hypothetical protein
VPCGKSICWAGIVILPLSLLQVESICQSFVEVQEASLLESRGYVRIGDDSIGTPNCGPYQSWKLTLVCYRQP